MIASEFQSSDIWMLVAIGFLLIILIFLAVAEMGLSRMTKPKAAALADKGHKSGPALQRLVGEPERWVNVVLLTVSICQTVQATLTGIVGSRFGAWGVFIGVVLNVVVFFVLAEAVPKTYAVLYPERAALLTARPTSALVSFPPLRLISQGLIGLTNWIMPGKGLDKGPFVSEQELLGIVEAAAQDEVIEHEERQLIESIIEFGDTVAREVMVPRPDIVFLHVDDTVSAALDVAIAQGYSRLPVLREDEDDVVGVAYTKDLMKAERVGHGERPVSHLVRSVRFVPENKPVARLMREMQAEKYHLAMVADEYGGIAGLVTLEDCLEELVGDIVDEYDVEEAEVQRQVDGDYLVDGGTSVDDLNELLDIEIPTDDWDTVGGFVFGTLGHVPHPGEQLDVGDQTGTPSGDRSGPS
jgi:putative hemolysin